LLLLVEAVRVEVMVTVDAGCSGAVGVMLMIDVMMWVVGSVSGAVEVMVMAVSWGLRLVNRAEAFVAARARAKRVE
jgi:hypothetical protein